MPNKNYLGFFK